MEFKPNYLNIFSNFNYELWKKKQKKEWVLKKDIKNNNKNPEKNYVTNFYTHTFTGHLDYSNNNWNMYRFFCPQLKQNDILKVIVYKPIDVKKLFIGFSYHNSDIFSYNMYKIICFLCKKRIIETEDYIKIPITKRGRMPIIYSNGIKMRIKLELIRKEEGAYIDNIFKFDNIADRKSSLKTWLKSRDFIIYRCLSKLSFMKIKKECQKEKLKYIEIEDTKYALIVFNKYEEFRFIEEIIDYLHIYKDLINPYYQKSITCIDEIGLVQIHK